MNEKKLQFTIDNFPFDDLRLVEKCRTSDYTTVLQNTVIEKDGRQCEYEISFPAMQSSSITYYVDPGKASNKDAWKDPKFYVYFTLHPHWSDPDEKGEVTKEESATGKNIEEFFRKFKIALISAAKRLKEDILPGIMGPERCLDLDKAFADPIPHEKFPKGHPKQRQPDLSKSRQLQAALWTQDLTKKKEDNNSKKRKQSNDQLLVPETTHIIYTSIFDAVPVKVNKKGQKSKHAKEVIKKEKITKYADMKKFVYASNADAAVNSSSNRSTLISETRMKSPTINWDPVKGTPGEVKWKLAEMKIIYCNSKTTSRELDENAITHLKESRQKAMAEFRLPQEDESSSSSSEENDSGEEDYDDSYESQKRRKHTNNKHSNVSISHEMNVDDAEENNPEETEQYERAREEALSSVEKND